MGEGNYKGQAKGQAGRESAIRKICAKGKREARAAGDRSSEAGGRRTLLSTGWGVGPIAGVITNEKRSMAGVPIQKGKTKMVMWTKGRKRRVNRPCFSTNDKKKKGMGLFLPLGRRCSVRPKNDFRNPGEGRRGVSKYRQRARKGGGYRKEKGEVRAPIFFGRKRTVPATLAAGAKERGKEKGLGETRGTGRVGGEVENGQSEKGANVEREWWYFYKKKYRGDSRIPTKK